MTDQDWKDFLKDTREDIKGAFTSQIGLSERLGALGEGTKNQLEDLNKKLNKPLLQTFAFWKFVISVLIAIFLICFFGKILIMRGGQFDVWGMKYSTCTNIIVEKSPILKP